MTTPRNLVISAMTALWLSTGCATSGTAEDVEREAFLTGTDQTEMVFIPPISQVQQAEAACDDGLVEKLIDRDVYERLAKMDNFNEMAEGLPEGAGLEERITAYKDDRREKISTFFDCRDQNKELHDLAASIVGVPADPANPDKFRSLFVDIASQRMDDVRALYPKEMVTEAAHEFKDFLIGVNIQHIEALGAYYKDAELDARITELIEDNHDQIALSLARLEMADYLGVEGNVEGTVPNAFATQFKRLVANEVAQYLREAITAKAAAGPMLEI